MKIITLMAVTVFGASVAFGAASQPAAPGQSAQPAPLPEKIELARRLVAASGGAEQINTLMKTIFQGVGANISNGLPPEQKRLQTALMQKMQERFGDMTPKLLDTTVTVYAQNLSEKELRDFLAWTESESGQALRKKLPIIARESVQMMLPTIADMTQDFKQDAVDEVCKDVQCSAQDRQALVAVMAKALPKQPS